MIRLISALRYIIKNVPARINDLTMLPRVFISYSRHDTIFVQKLAASLRATGLDVWVDWHDIPPGTEFKKEIREGIEKADVFLFVISPDSAVSYYCNLELCHARQFKKRIIPLYYRAVDENALKAAPSNKTCPNESADNWPFINDLNRIDFLEEPAFASAILKLDTAVRTDYDYLKEHTRLLNRALEWDNNHRQGHYLRRDELRAAQGFLSKGKTCKPEPTQLHKDYIKDSVRHQKRIRQIQMTASIVLIVAFILTGGVYFLYQQAHFNQLLSKSAEELVKPFKSNWIAAALGACEALTMDSAVGALYQDGKLPASFGVQNCPANVRFFVGNAKTNDALNGLGQACMALENFSCADGAFRIILKNPVISANSSIYVVYLNLALVLTVEPNCCIEIEQIIFPTMQSQPEFNPRDLARIQAKIMYDSGHPEKAIPIVEQYWNDFVDLPQEEEIAFYLAMGYQAQHDCTNAAKYWAYYDDSRTPPNLKPRFIEVERRQFAVANEGHCSPS